MIQYGKIWLQLLWFCLLRWGAVRFGPRWCVTHLLQFGLFRSGVILSGLLPSDAMWYDMVRCDCDYCGSVFCGEVLICFGPRWFVMHLLHFGLFRSGVILSGLLPSDAMWYDTVRCDCDYCGSVCCGEVLFVSVPVGVWRICYSLVCSGPVWFLVVCCRPMQCDTIR